ncbi:hypothetical protein [Azospirillum sp.]|uniref:hypothetical protein n=1 Tax=Azospirillum sp. TaxID=34012 RepID=UPI003D73BFC0
MVTTMALRPEERDIIRNALGLLHAKRPYRNHYCAPVSGSTRELLEGMADAGLMQRGRTQEGGTRYFHVTDAGAAAAGYTLPGE